MVAPKPTAGLKAPPEIGPPVKIAAMMVTGRTRERDDGKKNEGSDQLGNESRRSGHRSGCAHYLGDHLQGKLNILGVDSKAGDEPYASSAVCIRIESALLALVKEGCC